MSSVCALTSYKWDLKYEYGLPISVAGIIIIQFIFGIFGVLPIGFWSVAAISLALWIYTLYGIKKTRSWKKMKSSFFSEGFFVFLTIYAILNFILAGMVVHSSDEFSHWGRVVKAMVWLDDLGTNSSSNLTFFSYPPGVALFQYYLEKIYVYCTGEVFSEWHLYLAHSTLWLAFVIPVVTRIKKGNKIQYFLLSGIFFLLPILFYPDFYYSLYVDGLIGALAGCGFCWILLYNDNEHYDFIYLCSLILVLTLIKSTSFVLALGICLAFAVAEYLEHGKKQLKYSIVLLLGAIVLKVIWQIKVNMSGMIPPLSSNKIDIEAFFNVLTGNDTSYRSIVWNGFKRVLFERELAYFEFHVAGYSIPICYAGILACVVLITIIFLSSLKKRNKKVFRNAVPVIITGYIIYIIFNIGLLFTYLFKFSEAQSIALHSYSRYNNTLYLFLYMIAIYIFIIQGMEDCLEKQRDRGCLIVIVLGVIIMILPLKSFMLFLSRDTTNESIEWRGNFKELADKINGEVELDEKTYFICQDDRSWYNSNSDIQVSFQIYPRKIQYGNSYFTELEPDVDSEWFINGMDMDEFREELIQNYDYVAIHRQDAYFIEHYGELFEDQESIADDCLYKIDPLTGLLKKCN
jgi:hypothetical protein